MNISYRWLTSLAPSIHSSPEELAARLGMLGAPVDELVALGAGIGDILIARVEEVRPHPNADRLRLCTVNSGGEPLQVVCGAPNVEAGRFYPFAPIGTTMPGGMEIKKAKLRGEVSEGMLCSARELGLGRDHAGLMTLSGEWQPGSRLVDQLGLDDWRLVLDITPNRPDLLSHIGVARELAPGGVEDLQLPPFGETETAKMKTIEGGATVQAGDAEVRIEDPADCPRYMAAMITGIQVAPSPEWLASRLRAIGVRPINNVVDATNYVLHEVGQPLHAFDLDRLGTRVEVRRARGGEMLRTLDGVDRKLDESALVITDATRPVALAGIMGGEDTEVTSSTTRILIECALFDPLRVRKTVRALGLSTDASHRYERGVDPEGQAGSLQRVVDLILAVAGGEVVGPALDAHPAPGERARVMVRPLRVAKLLGVAIEKEEIVELLEKIGFEAGDERDGLSVRIPAFRPDVSREIDVIEEIARRRGYDSFEADLSPFRPGVVPTDPQVQLQARIHAFFSRWGFLEARTAAFAAAAEDRVPLLNPLSAEESHLRNRLVDGLLRRAEHNWSHGVRAIRLYEIGTIFQSTAKPESLPGEQIRLAGVLTGPRRVPHWSEESSSSDVWDLKGVMEELAGELGLRVRPVAASQGKVEALTPGESFEFFGEAGGAVGFGGRISESAIDAPAWADSLWAFEVELQPQARVASHTYVNIPEFPAVERDLALIVPSATDASEVERVIGSRGSDLLHSVVPFDLYAGKGIPEGTRSIAWRLKFRHPDRTLTDQEVDEAIAHVLRGLDEELNVRRR